MRYAPEILHRRETVLSITEQARAELNRSDYAPEDQLVLMAIVEKFLGHFDSGGAVHCALPTLVSLLLGKPLSPLTGSDDEWMDPMGDGLMLQNKRCGSVFKDRRDVTGELSLSGTELVHDIDAPEPFAPITFPYMPGESITEVIAKSTDPVMVL